MEINIVNASEALNIEKSIIAGMICDTDFLRDNQAIINPQAFTTPNYITLATWVMDYFNETGAAPQKAMVDIFMGHQAELPEATQNELLIACKSLSERNKECTPQISKNARNFFQRRAAELLIEQMQSKLSNKANEHAAREVADIATNFILPQVASSNSWSAFDIVRANQLRKKSQADEIFTMPGYLNNAFGGTICAGQFILLAGPAKSGKTTWLMYTALQAACQGKRVLYYSLEMPEEEVEEKWNLQILPRTTICNIKEAEYLKIEDSGDGKFKLVKNTIGNLRGYYEMSDAEFEKELTTARKMIPGEVIFNKDFDQNDLTIQHIKADLARYANEGNPIDVVVIDYADIMRLNPRIRELRDQYRELYTELKKFVNNSNIALITATQTNRSTADGKTRASGATLAEAYDKVRHVDRIIGINLTDKDKQEGICRLTPGEMRRVTIPTYEVLVTSCMPVGRVVMGFCPNDKVVSNQEEPFQFGAK